MHQELSQREKVISVQLSSWGTLHFRPYIYENHFTAKTYHRTLINIFSMINPSSKLIRMRLELEEYDFKVEYLKGKDNYVADALSRITIKDLQNITGNILKVTTRYQNRQKIRADSKEIELPTQSIEKVSKPNVCEVINSKV